MAPTTAYPSTRALVGSERTSAMKCLIVKLRNKLANSLKPSATSVSKPPDSMEMELDVSNNSKKSGAGTLIVEEEVEIVPKAAAAASFSWKSTCFRKSKSKWRFRVALNSPTTTLLIP